MLLHIQYTDFSGKPVQLSVDSDSQPDLFIGRRTPDFTPEINLTWDHGVARRHARLYYDHGTWYIEQLTDGKKTRVNTIQLVSGVPHELPAEADIVLGKEGKSVLHVKYSGSPSEQMPEGAVVRAVPSPAAQVSETRQIELLSRLTAALEQPGQVFLQRLVEELQREFPVAHSGGLALYHDKAISVPASFPPGKAQISFTLARRTLQTQQAVRWDRAFASPDSQGQTSLEGTQQALYVPILRGAVGLGVFYLHTAGAFTDFDLALLTVLSTIMGAAPQFQPDHAAFRLPAVFISYSHQDREFVKKLVADLRRQRLNAWFDERLQGGQEWEMQLAQAIRQSDAFALVMSPTSLASTYVQWEIEQARAANKLIIPLWYVPCDTVPPDLDKLQRITISGDRYAAGVLELVEDLYELVNAPPGTTPPSVPAPTPAAPPSVKSKFRVLFLAANPRDTDPLRLGEEVRTVDERLRSSEFRERFDEPIQKWAVRPSDLQDHILRYKPHIVHFSGHGSSAGEIILEDYHGEARPVDGEALARLFQALKEENSTDNVCCVVLNACFSAIQAQSIATTVGCVVGMSRSVSDEAAIAFAGAFYRALGYCKSVQKAFNLACAEMGFFDEHETPQLLTVGIDATKLLLC